MQANREIVTYPERQSRQPPDCGCLDTQDDNSDN